MCSWIVEFSNNFEIRLFLSDISGVFDKVDANILIEKCKHAGLAPIMLLFLKSFFAPRRAQVIVQNKFSKEFEISNQVYQGTISGPPMWNTFFADVATIASADAFEEAMFADDLNVYTKFNKDVTNTYVFEHLRNCHATATNEYTSGANIAALNSTHQRRNSNGRRNRQDHEEGTPQNNSYTENTT